MTMTTLLQCPQISAKDNGYIKVGTYVLILFLCMLDSELCTSFHFSVSMTQHCEYFRHIRIEFFFVKKVLLSECYNRDHCTDSNIL